MRQLQMEAAIWYMFTSPDFFKATANASGETMAWFGDLALSKQVANFGRNNQIFDRFKKWAHDFEHGAELAKLGDYRPVWNTARSVPGDVRGMMEQPMNSWMSSFEYQEFQDRGVNRILTYAGIIESALNNAIYSADSFLHPDAEYPERSNDDDGFPGDDIIKWYKAYTQVHRAVKFVDLPKLLPDYAIDHSTSCLTGEEVPWTGVWYPCTGLDDHSLTFAIKGRRMPAVYRVTKSVKEIQAKDPGFFGAPETIAVATLWHPIRELNSSTKEEKALWAKAGELCPTTGRWQPTDPGATERNFVAGETMQQLDSPHGLTVWLWRSDR